MAKVTVTLEGQFWGSSGTTGFAWQPTATGNANVSFWKDLGTSLSFNGSSQQYLAFFTLPTSTGTNVRIQLASGRGTSHIGVAGPDFSTKMEDNGTITLVASDGTTLVLEGIGDSTEPYAWQPSNLSAARAFVSTLQSLSDKAVQVTFNDTPGLPIFLRESGAYAEKTGVVYRRESGTYVEKTATLFERRSGAYVEA